MFHSGFLGADGNYARDCMLKFECNEGAAASCSSQTAKRDIQDAPSNRPTHPRLPAYLTMILISDCEDSPVTIDEKVQSADEVKWVLCASVSKLKCSAVIR